ncbi:hypothetical protein Plec18167_004246 [Paecilomyces lecythidis]|uniref:Uncharacterized protein n=1 Tax=Paecilomyces lecythidis TaxID=3004212 RepID=A0ABR3XT71_9EURO
MITHIRYGTFIVFGVLIALGAGFIWFFTPETSKLTLEEMDSAFGSSGVAEADRERMMVINREIGLDNTIEMIMKGALTAEDKPSIQEHEYTNAAEVGDGVNIA